MRIAKIVTKEMPLPNLIATTCPATIPFSCRERGYCLEPLPGGYGFVFNFENPTGIKLLSPSLYDELREVPNLAEGLSSLEPGVAVKLTENACSPVRRRLTVWLHVVNGCNFSCHYCYIPHLRRSVSQCEVETHSMKEKSIRPLLNNLIGFCRKEGLPELRLIFAGGEPTLNLPLIEVFCKEATKEDYGLEISFGMISNGSFGGEKLLPVLQRYKIKISLSVDGFEVSHDRVRFEVRDGRKTGSWELLAKNVELLVAEGITPYFLYTVTPDNYGDISRFASFAHSQHLGFRLSLVRERRTPSSETQAVIAEELCRFYQCLSESLHPRLPIFKYAAFAEWDLYQKKSTPCTSCRHYFAIAPDGGVATCQVRLNRTYGNAATEEFSRIVARLRDDPANHVLSSPVTREGSCTNCEFFHVCAGGCPQHTWRATGEMDRPSPWCHVYGTVLPEYIRAVARQLQRAVLDRSSGHPS